MLMLTTILPSTTNANVTIMRMHLLTLLQQISYRYESHEAFAFQAQDSLKSY